MSKEINVTEERQLTLLLTLYNARAGLKFQEIRDKMLNFYNNEIKESDQKKLHRDIEDLRDNGFPIKFQKLSYPSLESDVYKFERDNTHKKIQFEEIELNKLSALILRNFSDTPSISLFSAAQKIFSRNLDLFPVTYSKPKIEKELEKSKLEKITSKVLISIRDKTPIKIEYSKSNITDISIKKIDPIQIIKRNTEDFYLIAFDREKRKIRRYLLPKILKLTELAEEFLFLGKLNPDDLNYHSLNFNVHTEESLEIEADGNSSWKLERFFYPHPFQKKENNFYFKTTNRSALFSFMIKEPKVLLKINSELFINEFAQYKNKILKFYQEKK